MSSLVHICDSSEIVQKCVIVHLQKKTWIESCKEKQSCHRIKTYYLFFRMATDAHSGKQKCRGDTQTAQDAEI